jgi:AI-2 transport protein TqsA
LERATNAAVTAQVVLAVLAVMAALHLMKAILVPLALALMLACLLAPATGFLRRVLPLGATGAAVVLFLMLTVVGLYIVGLTAQNLAQAVTSLPADVERLSGQLSRRVSDLIRDNPFLRMVLPDPGTIDLLSERNQSYLMAGLYDRLTDVTSWVVQGLIVLVLVLFLLIEGEMLAPKVVRFFTPAPGDARAAERALKELVRQIRAYLLARTLINIGLGIVLGVTLWLYKIKFAFVLGAFVALTNFVPYVGQTIGGALPVLVTLTQWDLADALIVAAIYIALLGVEGYVVTPYVMGRSLDLNGTTVLVACLFWGFLWGLVGLVLAMPIAVSMKLVFQQVPSLYRWADLMSNSWQPPATGRAPAVEPLPTPRPEPIAPEPPDRPAPVARG